jgi:hypothetical protein
MDNKKENIVKALSECHGIVTDACKKTNTPRSTYYSWLESDPDFKNAVEETQEEAIDFVEGQLFKKINGVQIGKIDNGELEVYDQPPSDTAIIFYLKTKAKKRGYVERTEVEQSGSLSINWNEEKTYETKS